jgi:phosphatidylserine/phosphatidylglycerophosphate/cardiolipin synthase-like enzyme
MAKLSAATLGLIRELSSRASLCSSLFAAWNHLSAETPIGIRELTAAAGLSVSEEPGTERVLAALVAFGLLQPTGSRWLPSSSLYDSLPELAATFAAIDFYRQAVHKDDTEVQVVLTCPAQSVALTGQLEQTGWRTAGTEETRQSFQGLVQRASHRIVIMTPFFDEHGAAWLRELLDEVPRSVDIVLILRGLEDVGRWDYPKGFVLLSEWLSERRVRVFNYSHSRGSTIGRETFHAKVILADADCAYVGSANMTIASLENSMEMGVVLRGKAARQMSHVVDAVLRCADSWRI